MREALRASAAPVVAVTPIVDGEVLKGPTEAFLAWAGHTMDAAGVAAYYGDVLDGLVSRRARELAACRSSRRTR